MTQEEEPVLFRSGDFHLEGLLRRGDRGAEAFVLCHPHPQYGGNMHNNVVSAMATACQEKGISTLRFNFRGVGRSEGKFGDGIEERLDVEAAIDFFLEHRAPSAIHIGGYSFGAHVGLYVGSVDDRVNGFVAIAPPLVLYTFDFMTNSSKKKLLIAGADDPFCPSGRFREWFDSLDEPKAFRVIPQADHFFWGKEDALKDALKAYFSLTS